MGSYFIGSTAGLWNGKGKRSSISTVSFAQKDCQEEDEEKGSPRFHLCPSECDWFSCFPSLNSLAIGTCPKFLLHFYLPRQKPFFTLSWMNLKRHHWFDHPHLQPACNSWLSTTIIELSVTELVIWFVWHSIQRLPASLIHIMNSLFPISLLQALSKLFNL